LIHFLTDSSQSTQTAVFLVSATRNQISENLEVFRIESESTLE